MSGGGTIYSAMKLCNLRIQSNVSAHSTEDKACKEQTPSIYIGNYLAIAAFAGWSANLALWSHGYFEIFKRQFLEVDFNALRAHADLWKTAYTESTFWFDAHYGVFAVTTLVSVLLILNALWKIGLMSAEARLIREGKEAAA